MHGLTETHSRRRASTIVAALGLVFIATGCSSESGSASPTTVFVTRSAALGDVSTGSSAASVSPSAGSTAPSTSSGSAAAGPLPTIDRGFDAALIASTRREGEDLVLVIDRLTVAGLDDATLAANGTTAIPDSGDRFGNQRVALYEVGVAPDAVFVLTSCTRGPSGVEQTSTPLTSEEFASSTPRDAPVLLRYAAGLVSRAEVNPRC